MKVPTTLFGITRASTRLHGKVCTSYHRMLRRGIKQLESDVRKVLEMRNKLHQQ